MERLQTFPFQFQGGFASDLAPESRQLTFLTRAENVIYEVSGAVRKFGGATRLNSAAAASGANITGMYDFYSAGGSGSDTNRFIFLASNGTLHTLDSGGGTTAITGGASITASTNPVFAQLNDVLTFWTSDNDTPLSITSAGNAATLGGSPPAGRGAVRHLNRLWTWGDNSNPSQLRYSATNDPTTWSGVDSATISVDNDDGDRIIGCISHKEKLFVFKGPNKGSIHVISGRDATPVNSDLTRTKLLGGLVLQSPNGLIEVGDDVWFMTNNGVYSLAATQRFADFTQADLTRFLKTFFRDSINKSQLNLSWAVNYADKSAALFTFTPSGQSEPNAALGLSYIKQQEEGVKPFLVTGRDALSAAIRITSNKTRQLVFGSTDGYVLSEDQSTRILPSSTAYTMRVTTPSITLLPGDNVATLYDMYMKSAPVGSYNINVDVTRDDETAQTFTFDQSSSGFQLDTDALDTGVLGGSRLITTRASAGGLSGEARSVELDITQGGASQDAQIYEIGILMKPSSPTRSTGVTA